MKARGFLIVHFAGTIVLVIRRVQGGFGPVQPVHNEPEHVRISIRKVDAVSSVLEFVIEGSARYAEQARVSAESDSLGSDVDAGEVIGQETRVILVDPVQRGQFGRGLKGTRGPFYLTH